MYKFVTIKCRICNSVIYNLQENDFKKLKLINLTCEDCMDHSDSENFNVEMERFIHPSSMQIV